MLPKKNRADKKLVEKIFKEGRFINSPSLTLKFVNKETTTPRLSFVVPKKIEKRAVKRNFLKRQGYLILEKYFKKLPNGFSGVFVFKKNISVLEIENEIKSILNKIN